MAEETAGQNVNTQVSEEVLDFLSGFENFSFIKSFVEKFGQPKESTRVLLRFQDEVVRGKRPLGELLDVLNGLGVPESAGKAAAIDFSAHAFLPVSKWMSSGIEGQLSQWGADPNSFGNIKLVQPEAKSLPPEETPIQKALAGKGVVFSDPVLQHRLELIVASYRDGVRTREQAISVMMRPLKTGGLEMKEAEAGDVLALVSAELGEPAAKVEEAVVEPAVVSAGAGAKADSFTPEDEEEVRRVAETKKEAMEHPALITDTKAAAEKIAADAKLSFASGELKTRFEHIIDARLRDVRDGFETREKLEATPEQGGVGLSGVPLVAVMEMVEHMDAMHHKALAAEMAGKKEAAKAERAAKAVTQETVKTQEEQVMAKRYAEITGKAPQQIVTPTPSLTTVALPAADLIRAREQNIDTGKVRAAIEAAKAPMPRVTPVLSEPSIPQAASGRPRVEDIRFERKLSGPVEELRLLTLTDFRRLSKDPKQAILRVQDKVEIAAHEGYDRRIAAIRAWRESPLCQAYLSLSREALMGGKGVIQILAEKRVAGQDVPTDEELHAIVELNGILRF